MTVRQEEHDEPGDEGLNLISHQQWGANHPEKPKKAWTFRKEKFTLLGSSESRINL